MRNCPLDRRWPQVYGLKPVDPEQLIVTRKREPPSPSIPPSTVSAATRWILATVLPWEAHQWPLPVLLWAEFHTLSPIFLVTGVWWLKCIKKGAAPLKGSDLVSCHPSSGGATSSSPRRRVVMKMKQGTRRCWGGEVEGLEGRGVVEGVGGVSGTESYGGWWWW